MSCFATGLRPCAIYKVLILKLWYLNVTSAVMVSSADNSVSSEILDNDTGNALVKVIIATGLFNALNTVIAKSE